MILTRNKNSFFTANRTKTAEIISELASTDIQALQGVVNPASKLSSILSKAMKTLDTKVVSADCIQTQEAAECTARTLFC